MRATHGIAIAWLVLLCAPSHVAACGDKFLIPSTHRPALTSKLEGTIVVYARDASRREGATDPKVIDTMATAGFDVRIVATPDAFADAVRDTRCRLVLVDLPLVPHAREVARTAAPESVVVPVLVRPSGEDWDMARRTYRHAIRTPTRAARVLAVIEGALSERRAG